jgi:hypothetical protein
MFEEYLQDASAFFDEAASAAQCSDIRKSRRYYRAAVFYTSGAMEAFVNFIADTFEKGGTFTQHEIAFLTDKSLIFSNKNWSITEKSEFHRVEEKLKFLLHKFSPAFDFNNPSWSSLMELKKIRDSLIHPRQSEDDTSVEEYHKNLRSGMRGAISTMNSVSEAIFKRPLRQQILDLNPE